MAEMMTFPETFDEFVEEYGFVDKKEAYTNGSELIQVFRVKQWLDHEAALRRVDEDLLLVAPKALTKLAHHLLGKDWYSVYADREGIYNDIVDTICRKYRGAKEDSVRKWRRRHKRCLFCEHLEMLPDLPGVIRSLDEGWCRAKSKQVNYSRRRICGLFELKGKTK